MSLKKRILQAGAGLALAGFITSVNTTEAEAASWQPRTVSEIHSEIQTQVEGQDEPIEYTFKYGDTLWGISEAIDVSVDKLAQINDIENSNMIIAGNSIYLTANKDVVAVEKGDRVESYDVSEDQVKKTETPKEIEEKAAEDTPEENAAEQQAAEQAPAAVEQEEEVTEEQPQAEVQDQAPEADVDEDQGQAVEDTQDQTPETDVNEGQSQAVEDTQDQAPETDVNEGQGQAVEDTQDQTPEADVEGDQAPAADNQGPAQEETGQEDQGQPEADTQSSDEAPEPSTGLSASEGYTMNVEATAYSTNQASLSDTTATGINLHEQSNVVAVDPDVIPLGSTVEIPGIGTFIAGDTGGAINGNRIDIHTPSVDQALGFGRQSGTVNVIPN